MITVLLTSIVSSIALGQNTFVSQGAVDALKSGKFYLKLAGTRSYSEEGNPMNVPLNLEIAARNGASMSRKYARDLATGTVPGMLAEGISRGHEFKAATAIYSAANGELVKFGTLTVGGY